MLARVHSGFRPNFRLMYTVVFAALCAGLLWNKMVANADSLPNTGAPQGFSLTTVSNGGLDTPVNATFAPDGRIFVIEKGGAVKIVKNGQTLAQPFYTVANVNNFVDRGLLGLALDPNFATNGYVYLLFTYDNDPANQDAAKTGRLIRVTANGDVAVPGSEQVILGNIVGSPAQKSCESFPVNSDCIPADGWSHAPGTVTFGPDGKLYVTIGDAASYDDVDPLALRAQNPDSLAGKVLRINPDGTGIADNPFYSGNPNDNRSKVYAMGVRNSFRLNVRPSDGLVMLGDVGWNGWEEVNTVPKGANLGWPCYEGNEQQNGAGGPTSAYKNLAACQQMYQNVPANLKYPTHLYPHPPGSAIVGGVFYDGNNYPAQYKGRYFYGDYVRNQINSLALSGTNELVPSSNALFANNAAGPVAFFTGPQGDIYYVGIYTGSIYHLAYSTSNQPPIAVAAADKTSGPTPLGVNFTSSGSSDPENGALAFLWDFGDGTTSEEANPNHVFAADGTYTVTLRVTDEFNNADTKTLTIHAGQTAPDVTIATPADKTVTTVGQAINFSGSATDAQDGAMTPDKLNWQVIIQHCPLDSCHAHTMQTSTGANGTFNFPAHDGPYYIQIVLTVTDSTGLTTTKTVSVYPQGQAITNSLQFDGLNDYVTADAPQDFKVQQFTAEAMIKTLSTDTEGAEVISMGNNWIVRLAYGNVYFIYQGEGGAEQVVSSGAVNVVDGLWHHIAVTRTATEMKLYIDGVPSAQAPTTVPIDYTHGNDFILGRHGNGNDAYSFNGAIDEVRLWTTPRTDAQIAAYRSTTLPTDGRAGLTAYWQAEEGTGTVAADTSSTAAHKLTLMNGTTWTAGAPLSDPNPPATQCANGLDDDGDTKVDLADAGCANSSDNNEADDPVLPPQISDLKDTFTGTVLDTNKWTKVGTASRTTQNGTLNVAPLTNGTGFFGVKSKNRYELKNNAAVVEVPQTTTAGTNAETQFYLEKDSANKLLIIRNKNVLSFRHRVNNVVSTTNVTYDATSMRWWRIREAAGTIFMETSPDGTTWTVRRSFAKAFDLTTLQTFMRAGTSQVIANPGTAKFDNFNMAPTTPTPPANNALSFNGTTGKASTNGAGLYNTQTFTIETWAKVQAVGPGGGEVLSNSNNWGLRIEPDGNLVFFTHLGAEVWNQYVVDTVNLKDNAWHHVAVTKSASTLQIYVDTVLVGTFAAPETISYTLGNELVAGQHSHGDPNFNLTGLLDEVRIWNVGRTQAQLQADWKKELTLPQTGLIGYWLCNEASGAAVADGSGNNHPLALTTGVTRAAGFPKL